MTIRNISLLIFLFNTCVLVSQSTKYTYNCPLKQQKAYTYIGQRPLTISDIEINDYIDYDSISYKACFSDLLKNANTPIQKARVNTFIGLIYYRLYHTDSAKKYFENALKISDQTKNKIAIFETNHANAIYNLRVNNIKKFKQNIKNAYQIIDTTKDVVLYADLLTLEATYAENIGETDKALNLLYKSYKLIKNNSNTKLTITILNNIGNIYVDTKSFEKASIYLKKGLALSKKINNKYYIAIFKNSLGFIAYCKKNYPLAIKTYKEALVVFDSIHHYPGLYSCNSQLGAVYNQLGMDELAYASIKKSIEYSQKSGIKSYIVSANCRFASLLIHQKKFDEAEKHLLEAKKYEKDVTDNKSIIDIYYLLASLYYEKKEYKKAYDYQNEFVYLSDSIENIEVRKNMQDITEKYETELKEYENRQLKANLEYSKAKTIFFSLLLSILFLAILATIYYRNKAKTIKIKALNDKINQEKRIAKERIEDLKTEIINKNILIKEFEQEPKTILIDTSFSEKMMEKLSNDKNWGQFMIEFEFIHKNFFSNLIQKYPSLTQGDLRFLSLLKLNLNDQEIANLLYIEYSSVRRIKNRLKNKLNIHSIQEFLSNVN